MARDCSDPFDTLIKKEYRKVWAAFIRKYIKNDPARAKVVFFPGPKCLEWYEVYKPLGFNKKNCYGIEKDAQSAEEIRSRNPGFNIVHSNISDFLLQCADNDIKLDIINLDYTEYPQWKHFSDVAILMANQLLKQYSIMGLTFQGQREQKNHQGDIFEFLRTMDAYLQLEDDSAESTKQFCRENITNVPFKDAEVKDKRVSENLASDELTINRDNYIVQMVKQIATGAPSNGFCKSILVQSPFYEEAIERSREILERIKKKPDYKAINIDKRRGIIFDGDDDPKHLLQPMVWDLIGWWSKYFVSKGLNPIIPNIIFEYQRRPYFFRAREAYEYNSGSRMIADFFALDRDFSFMNPIMPVLKRAERDMKSLPDKIISEFRSMDKRQRKIFNRVWSDIMNNLSNKIHLYDVSVKRTTLNCNNYRHSVRKRKDIVGQEPFHKIKKPQTQDYKIPPEYREYVEDLLRDGRKSSEIYFRLKNEYGVDIGNWQAVAAYTIAKGLNNKAAAKSNT